MRSTNQLLTDRELIYAKNQFKIIQYKNKLTWIIPAVLACLGLLGFLLVDGQTLLFGIWMLVFAIIGVFFFIRKTYRTTFNILPTGQMMKGFLNFRFIGSSEHGQNFLFIDKHKLETPDGLENYYSDLVKKYKNKMVNVTLAVLEEKKGSEFQINHYSLLKIEHDYCIESAFKNHPKQFLKKVSYQAYFATVNILLFFFCLPLLIIMVLDFSDNLFLGPLVLSMILALSTVLMLQQKFFPKEDTKELELKEILKCTCM